jgi:hypothetical protein
MVPLASGISMSVVVEARGEATRGKRGLHREKRNLVVQMRQTRTRRRILHLLIAFMAMRRPKTLASRLGDFPSRVRASMIVVRRPKVDSSESRLAVWTTETLLHLVLEAWSIEASRTVAPNIAEISTI